MTTPESPAPQSAGLSEGDRIALACPTSHRGRGAGYACAECITTALEATAARLAEAQTAAKTHLSSAISLADENGSLLATLAERERELGDLGRVCEAQRTRAERLKAERDALKEEIEVLRLYGNKTCTAMADERLRELRAAKETV